MVANVQRMRNGKEDVMTVYEYIKRKERREEKSEQKPVKRSDHREEMKLRENQYLFEFFGHHSTEAPAEHFSDDISPRLR